MSLFIRADVIKSLLDTCKSHSRSECSEHERIKVFKVMDAVTAAC